MSLFICSLCQNGREFTTFGRFFHHITVFHQNEHNFHMTCDLNSACGVSYRTYAAYKAHVYRHHADDLYLQEEKYSYLRPTSNNQHLNANFNTDLNSQNDNSDINMNGNDSNELSVNDSTADVHNNHQETSYTDSQSCFKSSFDEKRSLAFLSDIQKSFTYFILQLREDFCLPKTTIRSISNYFVTLINDLEHLLAQQAIGNTTSNAANASSSITSSEVVKDSIELRTVRRTMKDVCHAIEAVTNNEYQFLNYCEKYFRYISPHEIIVSASGEKSKYSYFVPIDQTLASILHNQETLEQILNNIKQQQEAVVKDTDLMFSFRDGNYGSRIDDDSMLIQLYADEIGLTNPIGAKKDRHKMFMIYFSLEDVPDQYRSQLEQIYLVALCESVIFKDHAKAKAFFEPIVNNLNQLQAEGLIVNGRHVKFSFSTLVADNLASHQIGGFQSSFSTGYFCRRCFITYAEKDLPSSTSQFAIRTTAIHDTLVHQIQTNPNQAPLIGVIGQSVLRNLVGFHPILSLPADLMHDYLEGLCPIVIMSLLKEASSMHLLTYAGIQQRMENFRYGYFDSLDRPPPILMKHLQNDRIAATASQKLCLFRLFPIIFQDLTDKLPSYIVYKQLREILDLVLSMPFRKSWLPILRDLCHAFHHSMLTHFPTKIIPKLHFCTEYDMVINDYGPAIKQWSMRYEAFHLYFKRILQRSNNYKNIPKMLATKYRLKQAFALQRTIHLNSFDQAISIKKVRNNIFDEPMQQTLINHFGNISFTKDLQQCNKFRHNNVEYHRGSVYIIDFMNVHETPRFAQVMRILKMNYKWWLLVDILETISYNENICAWELKSLNNYSILDPCCLKYFHKGLDIYELNNSSFVSFTARLTF